jgi:hypothetical protein
MAPSEAIEGGISQPGLGIVFMHFPEVEISLFIDSLSVIGFPHQEQGLSSNEPLRIFLMDSFQSLPGLLIGLGIQVRLADHQLRFRYPFVLREEMDESLDLQYGQGIVLPFHQLFGVSKLVVAVQDHLSREKRMGVQEYYQADRKEAK